MSETAGNVSVIVPPTPKPKGPKLIKLESKNGEVGIESRLAVTELKDAHASYEQARLLELKPGKRPPGWVGCAQRWKTVQACMEKVKSLGLDPNKFI
jgi:hypothetical protein